MQIEAQVESFEIYIVALDTTLSISRHRAPNMPYTTNAWSFAVAWRLGKPQSGKSSPIFEQLLRLANKSNILKSRKNLKGTKIYIYEDLCKTDQLINKSLRDFLKDLQVRDKSTKGSIRKNFLNIWDGNCIIQTYQYTDNQGFVPFNWWTALQKISKIFL